MTRPRSPLTRYFQTYPFGVLLLATFVMIVGAPITAQLARRLVGVDGPLSLAPFTVLLTIVAAYAVWDLARSRARVIGAAGVILVLLGLSSVELSHLGWGDMVSRRTASMFHVAAQLVFLSYVTVTILRGVFRAPIVDGNILCGAACVYLLTGVLWGYAYTLLEILDPGSFAVQPPDLQHVALQDEPGWLVYFSFTTLTTVGFGDVLPARAFARSLSVLEAVIGQIMMVVMIARLVGLHVAHATGGQPSRFSIDDR